MTSTEVEVVSLPMAAAVNQALDHALATHPEVFLLGEDIADPGGGVYKATLGLSTKYGTERVRATPISEQAILGAAIGAAMAGMRPVAEIMMMDFLAVCMDQLSNHAAKLRYMSGGRTTVPMTVRTSAGAGMQFGAQHSEMLEAWLCHVPGLKVAMPSNPADAKGLLASCIEDDDPCVFVEPTMLYFVPGDVPVGEHRVPLGQAAVRRRGTDVTIVAWGRLVNEAMSAAATLSEQGIEAEVVDLRTLVPLDLGTVLSSAAGTTRVVIAHEAVRRAGFGAELAATVGQELFGQLRAPVLRVAAPDTPVPFAKNLEDAFVPGAAAIVDACTRAVSRDS